MKVCRKVFSYTTKDSWDKLSPIDVVMKELNEEVQAQNIISIQEESFYREWNPDAFKRLDSSAVLGTMPALLLSAKAPEDCKFCHSFFSYFSVPKTYSIILSALAIYSSSIASDL